MANDDNRVRWRMHPEWKGHTNEQRVKKVLRSLSPDSLSSLLFAEEETDEGVAQLLEAECKAAGIPIESVKYYWYKSEFFSINANNPKPTRKEILAEIRDMMLEFSPQPEPIKRKPKVNGRLAFINSTDIHIDKVGWNAEVREDTNHRTAQKRFRKGVAGLLSEVKTDQISEIWLTVGSDCLNSEGRSKATTNQTPQQVGIHFTTAYKLMKKLYIEAILTLRQIAPVKVIYVPGNHDHATGFYLAESLETYFTNYDDVSFDVEAYERKAYLWGNTFIGVLHGDKIKPQDQPNVFSEEFRPLWGQAKYTWILNGHFHSKRLYEYANAVVRYCSAISGKEAWGYGRGYMSKAAIELFLFDKKQGKVGEHSFNF